MMREGMWGPGFALAGDPLAAITLADCVLWAVFCGDLDRAESLIAKSKEVAAAQETVPASAGAPASNCAPPAGDRGRDFRYRYAWNWMQRKGQRCAVLVRGNMNSCLVEFEDGFRAVTSRNALRKA